MPINQAVNVSQPQALTMLSEIDVRMGISQQMIGRVTLTLNITYYSQFPAAKLPFKVNDTYLLV
jgi:hypothetical protein